MDYRASNFIDGIILKANEIYKLGLCSVEYEALEVLEMNFLVKNAFENVMTLFSKELKIRLGFQQSEYSYSQKLNVGQKCCDGETNNDEDEYLLELIRSSSTCFVKLQISVRDYTRCAVKSLSSLKDLCREVFFIFQRFHNAL